MAVEAEILDAPISGDALALLLRVRLDSYRRESDGFIEERALRALAVYHDLPFGRLTELTEDLITRGLLERVDGGYRDIGFLIWNRSHQVREQEREGWRSRQRRHRETSRRDSTRESRNGQEEEQEQELFARTGARGNVHEEKGRYQPKPEVLAALEAREDEARQRRAKFESGEKSA